MVFNPSFLMYEKFSGFGKLLRYTDDVTTAKLSGHVYDSMVGKLAVRAILWGG